MQRILKARNLLPWLVDTFKSSKDEDLEAKLVGVGCTWIRRSGRWYFYFDEETQVSGAGSNSPQHSPRGRLRPGGAGHGRVIAGTTARSICSRR